MSERELLWKIESGARRSVLLYLTGILVLLSSLSFEGRAAPAQVLPRDALVLEKKIPVRQFADSKARVLATLNACDEVLLLETTGKPKAPGYVEVLFLSADAQKVRKGWIRKDSPLYIFPEPRPSLPRMDTTPQVAFPWAEKSPQPGDPEYARVTSKEFLFACLARPHPTKVAAIFTQLLDRYIDELTKDDVIGLLPLLRYARDTDYARIRLLLAKFKDDPTIAEFLKANPLFGEQVIEPEVTAVPIPTATPAPQVEEGSGLPFGLTLKQIGIGVGGVALLLVVLALVLRGRRKKPVDFTDTTGTGPSI